ncbi:ferrous iron transport protein A [Candidatus Poribacteria bacterium]|nr:ferrous iron transport protein A [Candidatus Poribacteria bacterium]
MDQNIMPLSMLAEGEEAFLVDVRGGHGFRRRLASMGLNAGMKITMVRNSMSGSVVVGVMDSRIALGRGMAHRIYVSKN